MRKGSNNKKRGFSMVEIIIAVSILAVVTAVMVPSLIHYVEKSRAQKDDSAMSSFADAVSWASSDDKVVRELAGASDSVEDGVVVITFSPDENGKMTVDNAKLGDKKLKEAMPSLARKFETWIQENVEIKSNEYKGLTYYVEVENAADPEKAMTVAGHWGEKSLGDTIEIADADAPKVAFDDVGKVAEEEAPVIDDKGDEGSEGGHYAPPTPVEPSVASVEEPTEPSVPASEPSEEPSEEEPSKPAIASVADVSEYLCAELYYENWSSNVAGGDIGDFGVPKGALKEKGKFGMIHCILRHQGEIVGKGDVQAGVANSWVYLQVGDKYIVIGHYEKKAHEVTFDVELTERAYRALNETILSMQ